MITKFKDGTVIPCVIRTNERIFQLWDYEGDYILCNLSLACTLIKEGSIKSAKHLWDGKFKVINKKNILDMGKEWL